jgi:phospholipid/cholesterol/gamma-HCH transport system substrate-binding protein
VAESVQLDEIFRTFDARTRAAFKVWQRQAAIAIQGQGQSFSNALAELDPFLADLDRLFRVLDSQEQAVRQLFSNGAVTLRALRGREGQLADLIQSSNAVFTTAAARDRDIEALFQAFPTFLDESKLTYERLKSFAVKANPVMQQLVPVAEELSPTVIALSKLAPEAKGFFEGFGTVIDRSPRAFPALRKLFRDDFPVLLRALDPFARNLNPIVAGLDLYKRELTATAANVASATNRRLPSNAAGEQIHYLRAMGPFGPESLASFPRRLTVNRNSAYSVPGGSKHLASGLLNFDTRQCSGGITATLDPSTPSDPTFRARVEGKDEAERDKKATELFDLLKRLAYAGQENSASIPAPGCSPQPPLAPINGSEPPTLYQHFYELGG